MNKKQIGEFVKSKRTSKGLSQKKLAGMAGIRRQSIMEVETSSCSYSIDRLTDIIKALDCDLTIEELEREPEMYSFTNIKPTSRKISML